MVVLFLMGRYKCIEMGVQDNCFDGGRVWLALQDDFPFADMFSLNFFYYLVNFFVYLVLRKKIINT